MPTLTHRILADSPSVVHVLSRRAAEHPQRVAFRFLEDGEHESALLTYAELETKAKALAARLLTFTEPGDRALFVYPPCLDFVVAFFGCLMARVVPVPVYPPRQDRSFERLAAVVRDASATLVLTTQGVMEHSRAGFDRLEGCEALRWVPTDAVADGEPETRPARTVGAGDIAFLQYTSGSTGDPKGVVVLHRNLVANIDMVYQVLRCPEEFVSVSWLPQFHDMGLIGTTLYPLCAGGTSVQMPPTAFLQRPGRWLEAISTYRGYFTTAPNFAYELCSHKVKDGDLAKLDLSCWALALNGAEPIRHDTLVRFNARFAPAGLAPDALLPCYGMAEATLIITGKPAGRLFTSLRLDRPALERHDVRIVDEEAADAVVAVSSGRSIGDEHLLIVGPETGQPSPPLTVGEIWVSGPHVADGYWGRPEATRETFLATCEASPGGTYLRTGDLGFLHDGELYITGRHKDLVIVGGRNLYPQDLEYTVERASPAVRKGSVAAFSIEGEDGEALVVVAEIERGSLEGDHQAVVDAIVGDIAANHEVGVAAIELIRPGAIPKTSSGKIQRRAARREFVEGRFDAIFSWSPSRVGGAASPQAADEAEAARLHDLLTQWFLESGELETTHIDIDRPLAVYGLDSVTAGEFSVFVETLTGERVPANFLWEYQTIRDIARFVIRRRGRPS